ncbi:NAD(P)H-hydrate dehydratase [Halomonas sp. NCCP-2165]|nr:NAD(P)H-hydrate dehydratase [Halomonas sp. NCCP-2165]GKW49171.1 bifunctional NAD(P)H-hydrate repair enzyme [Halomonas sp. NCCP-2165]
MNPGRPLYLVEQVRELDRRTIAAGIEGFALMQKAARAAYRVLRARWPEARHLSVLCGAGNNAGDGYVLAALAAAEGLRVQLLALRPVERLDGDAARAAELAVAGGVTITPWTARARLEGEVIVDALLGTGLSGEVREPFLSAIQRINAAGRPVLAVDIPSGLCADSGAVLGAAVAASATVTFIGDKLGLHTGAGPGRVGERYFKRLGVDAEAHGDLAPVARLLDEALIGEVVAPRPRDAHKGDCGHLLVIGGAPGFGGAALLAAETAARLGAGKVSLATAPEHVTASLVRCPEVMVHGVRGAPELAPLLAGADAIVVGPGLGQGPWGQGLLQAALDAGKPLVADADALNLLARGRIEARPPAWILTPHLGEAARLLGGDAAGVQADRAGSLREIAARFAAVVLLKGAGSLVGEDDGAPLALCPYGNPGMASGGMGDALSGILGALLAQGLAPRAAAEVGMLLHARAADLAARAEGERGLLAGDLASYARRLINGVGWN